MRIWEEQQAEEISMAVEIPAWRKKKVKKLFLKKLQQKVIKITKLRISQGINI
jgi:hypothetical protein